MNAKLPLTQKPLAQLVGASFTQRHIGPDAAEQAAMLTTLGLANVSDLIDQTVPGAIRLQRPLAVEPGLSEVEALAELKRIASQNQVFRSYIGQGYYDTQLPAVIVRNVLENPAWYTAYTPYQPEISQGRLESLLNFQQIIMDLTGLDLANASLLDEATAAAEAMTLCQRANRRCKSNVFFVADDVHPQTLAVLATRAEHFGFELVVAPAEQISEHAPFGALFQYPGTDGRIADLGTLISNAKAQGAMVAVASDLLALMVLKSPGELGADIVLGSAQRFGVPMGYGGPHAAFFAAREDLKRQVPGRIIGVSVDSRGNTALRMAMQTREQHIRREKATSNICTAQALLANLAAFYAVYHGPEGLKTIAERVHRLTGILALGLQKHGIEVPTSFFDTLTLSGFDASVHERARSKSLNLRDFSDGRIGISLDETTTEADLLDLFSVFLGDDHGLNIAELDAQLLAETKLGINPAQRRTDAVLTHPVFNRYHSETEMLRYIRSLENKDYSLVHGMIPLGSCTMKLNATAEMIPVTWPEFAKLHPFAPVEQAQGYARLLADLERDLAEITGYDAISLQPNSGAQGEYAGLLAIRRYQQANGEGQRTVCLIPASAHGTNPASAAMMSMDVVIVNCDDEGNVDLDDLRAKAEAAGDRLSACMITYPSTHGVYEEGVRELCDIVHQFGGQVYLDGANLNAQVGLTQPGFIGSDVSHLNLHKTFAIPHGGGGPGMGPIGVKAHLAPYLPGHCTTEGTGAVSAAPYGSAGILPITWMYNRMLGRDGLRESSEIAILNANYIAKRLEDDYSVLYRGRNGRVAHECILDIRPLKAETGITEEDIAKRLMDYGFHAPTMSFPVPGTLMIEPTESESQAELDRFIEAMQGIRAEIEAVKSGQYSEDHSPLRLAPHTQQDLVGDWDRPYSREQAVFPTAATRAAKFWPAVNRVDNVHGDRNFMCSCPGTDSYRVS
ncbi:aminomethyl-transferring glycine dehydrogenase [Saccharospirillum alexandrii]|uniref:aminomethyl-transferring glycine dehydrogenase n=1 Tax=Saccharospirillum alexandrii TaxID=2448477 RepID=UPI001FE46B8B|nr:aminomethyl-transferring glycine dehydrogenase [Saccharospirillum alexandrii]